MHAFLAVQPCENTNSAFCFMLRRWQQSPPALTSKTVACPKMLRRAAPRALVGIENASGKFRDRIQCRLRSIAMRRVSGIRDHRHFDRTVALFRGNLDLTDRSVLVV